MKLKARTRRKTAMRKAILLKVTIQCIEWTEITAHRSQSQLAVDPCVKSRDT